MLKYFSNISGMVGVAMVATAFFNESQWLLGTIIGIWLILLGAFFQALADCKEEKDD